MNRPAWYWEVLIVALIAIIVRAGSVTWLHANGSTSDEGEYVSMARHMANGGEFIDSNGERSTRAPLFPLFLSFVYRLFGGDFPVAHVIGSILGTLIVLLTYFLSLRIWHDHVGAISAMGIMALYPGLIIFSGLVQTETLYILLLLVVLLCAYVYLETGSLIALILLGFAAGFASLTRAVFAGFMPILLLLVLWRRKGMLRRENAYILLAFAVWLLVLAPWTFRNYQIHGELMPVSSGGGNSLLTGNNPFATGGWRLKEGFTTWYNDRARDLGVSETDGLSEVERNSLSGRLAWLYIKENPIDVFYLSIKKAYMFWVFPITNSDSNIPLQAAAVAGDVILYAGAAIGVVLTWKRRRWLVPVYACVLFFFLVQVVLHCESRFRLPLMPMAGLFFGQAVATCIRRTELREFFKDRRLVASAAFLLSVLVLVYSFTAVLFMKGVV